LFTANQNPNELNGFLTCRSTATPSWFPVSDY
jgi:hypothetical protein